MSANVHGLPIRTASLVLRQFMARDAEPIRLLNGEPSTSRWLPSHVYESPAVAEAALEYLISAYAKPGDPRHGPYVLAVERSHDARLLGHVGFGPLDGEVEVSYAIAESARGHGFGAEALAHACTWAGRAFRLPTLVAITATDNVASRRVLERARFFHVRDDVMRFQGADRRVSHHRWRATDVGGAAV